MPTITPAQIAREILNGRATAPDPIVRELVPSVARLWDVYEEIAAALAPLRAELQAATRARADWRHAPEAVYTTGPEGLRFQDAHGVALQNEVRRLEREIRVQETRAERAQVAYYTAAIEVAPSVRDEARARMADTHRAAQDAAKALVDALASRRRFWNAAGQPVGEAVEDSMIRYLRSTFQSESAQASTDLDALLPKALALPPALARELAAEDTDA